MKMQKRKLPPPRSDITDAPKGLVSCEADLRVFIIKKFLQDIAGPLLVERERGH